MFDKMQSEITDLRQENSDLRRSLEFSQNEIEALKTDVISMKKSSCESVDIKEKLDKTLVRMRGLEDGARAKNIRITGVEETSPENSEQTQDKIQKMICNTLKLKNLVIKNAYRVGTFNSQDFRARRLIIAELSSVNDKIR